MEGINLKRILIKDAKDYIDKTIKIQGRIKKIRCHGKLAFLDLMDRT